MTNKIRKSLTEIKSFIALRMIKNSKTSELFSCSNKTSKDVFDNLKVEYYRIKEK